MVSFAVPPLRPQRRAAGCNPDSELRPRPAVSSGARSAPVPGVREQGHSCQAELARVRGRGEAWDV